MTFKSGSEPISHWEKQFRYAIDSAILWSLDKGWLSFNGRPIYLHAINRQSLLFFKAAISRNISSLLVYPSAKMSITPLLALEALYYRVHEKRLQSGRDRLVIYSSRVELRNEIKEYFLAFKAGTMPLAIDAFPLGRITSQGEAIKILSRSADPRLLISPGPVAIPNSEISKKIFGTIIEATSELVEEHVRDILDWMKMSRVPFLFVITPEPPNEFAMQMIEKKFCYWGWERSSLEEDCKKDDVNFQEGMFNLDQPFCGNYQEIRNKGKGVKKVIIPVKEDKLNEMFTDLRKDYSEIIKSASSIDSPIIQDISKRYLGCLYALEEMTSPLAYAEAELGRRWGTIPVKRRIDALKNQCLATRSENPLFASFTLRCTDKILELYAYLAEKKAGKHPIIIQIIKEGCSKGKSVLFVSKNEALNEALKLYLEVEKKMDFSKQGQQSNIEFFTANRISRGLVGSDAYDTCIIYGCPRYYQRDILSFANAPRMGIIAYTSEIPAIKFIQNEIDEVQSLFSESQKVIIATSLLGREPKPRIPTLKKESEKPETELIFLDPQDAEMGGFTPEAIFYDFLSHDWSVDSDYTDEAEAKSAIQRFAKDQSDNVAAVKITFSGGRFMFLYTEKEVQIYDESTEKTKLRVSRNLKKGDMLILIENSTRKSLAESVINKVESHPVMMQAVVYQRTWIAYLKQALEESGDGFADVIHKLHDNGAKGPDTPGAIFHWINGAIIGPQDLENIRRIGIIYNKQFLVEHFKKIVGAVKRLRTIHRSLASRLSRLIPYYGIEANRGNVDNTVIDEELDLYLEDFVNIVSLERIEAVEMAEMIPVGLLDKIFLN